MFGRLTPSMGFPWTAFASRSASNNDESNKSRHPYRGDIMGNFRRPESFRGSMLTSLLLDFALVPTEALSQPRPFVSSFALHRRVDLSEHWCSFQMAQVEACVLRRHISILISPAAYKWLLQVRSQTALQFRNLPKASRVATGTE